MPTYNYPPITAGPNYNLKLSPSALAALPTPIVLSPGDTLAIPAGQYRNINITGLNGSAGLPITLDFSVGGLYTALMGVDNSPAYDEPESRDCSYLIYKGLRTDPSGSAIFPVIKFRGNCHHITVIDGQFKGFSGQAFEVFDSGKTFNGTVASTFHDFLWDNCLFSDFSNGAAITAGTGNLNTVCVNFEVKNCTFSKASASGQPAQFLSFGYMFACNIHHNLFEFLSVVNSPTGHNASIALLGYGDIHHNRFGGIDQPGAVLFPGNNFGNECRFGAICSTMTGYNAAVAQTRVYNNLAWNKRKYPFFENNLQNNVSAVSGSGGLLALCTLHTQLHNNTLYKTRATRTYGQNNGDATYAVLNGALIDAYSGNIDYNNNIVVDPEIDERTSGATIADPVPYLILFHAGAQPGVIDGGNNQVYKDIATAQLNTATYTPTTGSPVIDAVTVLPSWITDDLYGTARPQGSAADLGAVEKTGSVSNVLPTANAGSDQTITLPSNSVNLTGSGSDSDGSIVGYSWTKVSGPTGSVIASPATANTAVSGMTAGVHIFRLTVTDNSGGTGVDDITITVNAALVNNIYPGPNAVVARQNISFALAGFNSTNTIYIYKIENPLKSWVPDRGFNAITGFEAGKGYYIIAKATFSTADILYPPL